MCRGLCHGHRCIPEESCNTQACPNTSSSPHSVQHLGKPRRRSKLRRSRPKKGKGIKAESGQSCGLMAYPDATEQQAHSQGDPNSGKCSVLARAQGAQGSCASAEPQQVSPRGCTGQHSNHEGPDIYSSLAWQQKSARAWAGHQLEALRALADEHKQAMRLTGLALLTGGSPAADRGHCQVQTLQTDGRMYHKSMP